jgi:hypothetical protein
MSEVNVTLNFASREPVIQMVKDKIKSLNRTIGYREGELVSYEETVHNLKEELNSLRAEMIGYKQWLLSQGVEDVNPEN